MTPSSPTVVAGLLEQHGRVLACQRRQDQAHPGEWEFPGGKVEPGEDPPAALARELAEELAIDAVIGPEIERYRFAYPGKPPILLIFFLVTRWTGSLETDQFADARWVEPVQLPSLDFLAGDVEFVNRLARRRAPLR